jgi:hypothetical protein
MQINKAPWETRSGSIVFDSSDRHESWLKAWASYLALVAEERVAIVAT